MNSYCGRVPSAQVHHLRHMAPTGYVLPPTNQAVELILIAAHDTLRVSHAEGSPLESHRKRTRNNA